MTNLVLNFKNIYHIFREKSEKQQKRDAKKAEKQAKKAAHKTDVGQVSNVESGSGDNEPDHSVSIKCCNLLRNKLDHMLAGVL